MAKKKNIAYKMRIKCNQWSECCTLADASESLVSGNIVASFFHKFSPLFVSFRFFFLPFLFNFFFLVSFIHFRFERRRAFHFVFSLLFKIQVSRVATMLSHSRRKAVILLTSKMVNANYLKKKTTIESSTAPHTHPQSTPVYDHPRPVR